MHGNLEFNLFREAIKIKLYSNYAVKFNELGVEFEKFYYLLGKFLEENDLLKLDESYLLPCDFIKLCTYLKIDYTVACDEYYEFIFIKDFSEIILDIRRCLNLSQKNLSQECCISPIKIGEFENRITYPNRRQYIKLKKYIS